MDIGHHGMDVGAVRLTKPVNHGQANEGHVEKKDSTYVGEARPEGLDTCLLAQTQGSLQDEVVRQGDEQGIQPNGENDDHESIDDVNLDAGAG